MKILIGSNGGLTGIYLAKQYRKSKDVCLLGADSSSDSTGRFFVDKQFTLPSATEKTFIQKLIELLRTNDVDYYIPTHSKEVKVVAHNSEYIRRNCSTRFLVCPSETFDALENKRIANKQLERIGIPVPALIEGTCSDYPIIMKKDVGSGSNGIIRIENSNVHQAYMDSISGFSFYHLINGREFTVDCMFDNEGRLIGFNQRERIKTIGGAVSITRNSTDIDIEPWILCIAKEWRFCGCVNFQYIVQDNVPYFIDINLRFPSGGLPLSVASGLDIPNLMIDVMEGKTIHKFTRSKNMDHLTMYRYFEEMFE